MNPIQPCETPWEDDAAVLGTDKQGRPVWCIFDDGWDDDHPQPAVESVDRFDVNAFRENLLRRHVIVGAGDPNDGGFMIELRRGAAVRLTREILRHSLWIGGAEGYFGDDDFGFIHRVLSLPYRQRRSDSDNNEIGVQLDPDFQAFADRAGVDLDEVAGAEWHRLYADYLDDDDEARDSGAPSATDSAERA
jgi:hypothetical protein